MRRLLIISGYLLLIILSACTIQSDIEQYIATAPDTYAQGEQIYARSCASCHGENGEGQFPDAPMERDSTGRIGAPPHNSEGHTWHHDDDLLYQIVRDGGMGNIEMFYPMPAFGDQLSDEDIESVIFYIRTFWTEEQRQRQQSVTDAVRSQSQ
ncbi:MAG: cytochrome c [Phototrophicaceae bacterium]